MSARAAGLPIEVVSADFRAKPDIAVPIARRWLDLDGVSVIVDLPYSQVALAVSDVGREKDRAILVASGATSDLTGKACNPVTTH